MELRHLRYLIASAEEEHFGRAAERLHVTRSAVSQTIADLEQELGVALFERQAQKIRLTAAGRAMLPRLNALMRELDETIALGRRVGQGKQGLLRVGYGSLATHHPVFRAAVKRFHEAYPGIVLSLVEVPTSRQVEAMQEGAIQAGFMHVGTVGAGALDPSFRWDDGSVRFRGGDGWGGAHGLRVDDGGRAGARPADRLQHIVIDSAALGLIVAREHALAQRASVRLHELAGQPLVMVYNSQASPAFSRLFQLCRDAGVELQIVQEVSATITQQDLVAVGVGLGISVVGGRHAYPAELCAIPFEDVHCPVQFQLAWTGAAVEPALQRLVEVVQAVAQPVPTPAP